AGRRRGPRGRRSRPRDGHPAGGAAPSRPAPPSPARAPTRGRRSPARCPSRRPSSAVHRHVSPQRWPPSPPSSLPPPPSPPPPPPAGGRAPGSRCRRGAEGPKAAPPPPLVLGQDLLPHLSVPDAELVDIARDRHVALDTRVLAEQGREQDPALAVERELLRRGDVEGAEGHDVLVGRGQGAGPGLGAPPPREGGPHH